MANKTSDAQIKAVRQYEKRNKEKVKGQSYKRTARLFIRTYANLDDIKELRFLLDEKEKVLNN